MTLEQALAFRRMIEKAASSQSDEDALESIELFPRWSAGLSVSVGSRYRYGDKLYKVVQAHTTQADWTPDVVPALFAEVSVESWPEWKQPTGAQDAYAKGDKVSFNGKHYESLIDGNVWSPEAYPAGWKEV